MQSTVIILPRISLDLGIPQSRQQWIISAYYITYGCFLLLWGRLADLYGRRAVFLIGSVLVTAATLAVPFANSEIPFLVLRGIQGLGGAANVSAGLGILGSTFTPGRAKNYAFSTFGAAHSLGVVMGILAGGVIGEYLGWKWVFWIFSILAALTTVTAYFVISKTGQPLITGARHDVDWLGGALITASLILLTLTLTEAQTVGWKVAWVPTLLVLSLVLGAVFVFWQLYLERRPGRVPLLKMSIWKNGSFSAVQVVLLVFYGSFNNFLLFATYLYVYPTCSSANSEHMYSMLRMTGMPTLTQS